MRVIYQFHGQGELQTNFFYREEDCYAWVDDMQDKFSFYKVEHVVH